MKKKIFALVLCICMCLSVFSGCSLWNKKGTYAADTVIAEYRGRNITYSDLEEKYSAYSQYFAYYDEDVVMNIIFEETYLSVIQEVEAKNALTAGTIKLSQEDLDEILEDVCDSIISVINDYEKTYINNAGKAVPSRITNTGDDEEKDEKAYEEYKFEPIEPKNFTDVTAGVEKSLDEIIEQVHTKVFTGIETDYVAYRAKAWNKYAGDLMYSYKMEGETLNESAAITKKIEEVYNKARIAKLTEIYREYVESLVFGEDTFDEQMDIGATATAFQSAIVREYKDLLSTSKQGNTIEKNYTKVVFSTSNEDLVLYHYNGEDTFFTVQHLLVNFTDDQVAELKEYIGYDKTKAAMFRKEYLDARKAMAGEEGNWLLETSYRDENGKTVQEVKTDASIEGEDKTVYQKEENGVDFKLDSEGNKIPVKVDSKISLNDIITNFESAYLTELAEYLDVRKDEENDPSYVLTDDEKSYVRGRLFNEYVYLYTNDTGALGSGKVIDTIGYGISNDEEEDGGLMSEFADCARELYTHYNNNEPGSQFIGEELGYAITDYGVHVMMLSGVYAHGEVVVTQGKTDIEIFEAMKDYTFANTSTKTLLNYVYEEYKTKKLANFYSKHLYENFYQAKDGGTFKEYLKPTYNDLSGR